MNDQDKQSVLALNNQGKYICYYSELDPFAGQWRRLPPEKAAKSAINDIKILCLVFHHVIIPPGYLIKNPALWIVLNRLKPLFEHGLLSICSPESKGALLYGMFFSTGTPFPTVTQWIKKYSSVTCRPVLPCNTGDFVFPKPRYSAPENTTRRTGRTASAH